LEAEALQQRRSFVRFLDVVLPGGETLRLVRPKIFVGAHTPSKPKRGGSSGDLMLLKMLLNMFGRRFLRTVRKLDLWP